MNLIIFPKLLYIQYSLQTLGPVWVRYLSQFTD